MKINIRKIRFIRLYQPSSITNLQCTQNNIYAEHVDIDNAVIYATVICNCVYVFAVFHTQCDKHIYFPKAVSLVYNQSNKQSRKSDKVLFSCLSPTSFSVVAVFTVSYLPFHRQLKYRIIFLAIFVTLIIFIMPMEYV